MVGIRLLQEANSEAVPAPADFWKNGLAEGQQYLNDLVGRVAVESALEKAPVGYFGLGNGAFADQPEN